ncbi:replicative DNA helicase [Chitinophaga tropicalis]|uniref:Replicative DNA helicase n=1 Tax=Chitinophaga tropicalis TaxID=2683588 RepID=A0A7K1UAM9_9BACT|nr:replicative DNA helicase [Chitinophaga tropicalis]MVT11356.1 replicative DNA helicase [Chitinophaga tropicalis]
MQNQQQKNISKSGQNWRRKPDSGRSVETLAYGKIPPQAKEMEEAVLGACMLEKQAMDIIIGILKPECFYVDAHKTIYQVFLTLSEAYQPIDILTVVEQLRKAGELELVGGPYYITQLTNKVVSSANIEAHARIIVQKFMQRELIRIGGEIVNDAFEDTSDVFDSLDKAEAQLFSLNDGNLRKDFKVLRTAFNSAMKIIKERMQSDEEITGVPSGFPSLDNVTHGWQDTDLIIIAARPSVGKTAFALNLARNAAMNTIKPTNAAVFCLEMSTLQITCRLISAESGVSLDDITQGNLTDWQLENIWEACDINKLQEGVFIDDTPALSIFELRAKARRLVYNHGVGVIIIDYLQLMSAGSSEGKPGLREQEVSKISRDLKALAKELHVPILALSQLSREVEKRKGGAVLSDLRESGAIEQDADMVMFLSRPDYQQEASEVDPALRGKVDVKIAKHRNGKLATIPLDADLSIQKFSDPCTAADTQRTSSYISKRIADKRFSLESPPPPLDTDDDTEDLPF